MQTGKRKKKATDISRKKAEEIQGQPEKGDLQKELRESVFG